MAASAQTTDLVQRLTQLTEQTARGTEIEIVEVQLRGSGKARLLRVYIDKVGGVTHGDCELISERLGTLLDESDVIPGDSYTLEVSSPGSERKLATERDFERVLGRKVKCSLKEPRDGQRHVEGKLTEVRDGLLVLELQGGRLELPLQAIGKASLKFEP